MFGSALSKDERGQVVQGINHQRLSFGKFTKKETGGNGGNPYLDKDTANPYTQDSSEIRSSAEFGKDSIRLVNEGDSQIREL